MDISIKRVHILQFYGHVFNLVPWNLCHSLWHFFGNTTTCRYCHSLWHFAIFRCDFFTANSRGVQYLSNLLRILFWVYAWVLIIHERVKRRPDPLFLSDSQKNIDRLIKNVDRFSIDFQQTALRCFTSATNSIYDLPDSISMVSIRIIQPQTPCNNSFNSLFENRLLTWFQKCWVAHWKPFAKNEELTLWTGSYRL